MVSAPRWIVLSLLALVSLLGSPLRAQDYERWYVIEISGQRAGWAMLTQTTGDERITTRSKTHLSIKRGAAEVRMTTDAEFVETAEHKPVSIVVTQKLGAGPTELKGTYEGDGVHIVKTHDGQQEAKIVPLPEGEWLTPAAADRYVRQRLAAMPEKIVVRTIELGGGLDVESALAPAVITRTRLEPATLKVGTREVSGVRCVTTSSTQPDIESKEVLDMLGVPMRSEVSFGPLVMVMTAADRNVALAGGEAPELMIRTFISPDREIAHARTSRKAVFLVSVGEGALPAIPSSGAQNVERVDDRTARVTIDLARQSPAPDADPANADFGRSSGTITSGDARVQALALAGGPTPENAEKARRAVHAFINRKNLDVGFATAAEVARTRTGDCTEHAVLLAAVLRAMNIPSRAAAGLVYADEFEGEKGIFAYHMWTQALLDLGEGPTWVDLDATMPDAVPFDATHIALVVSPLADGQTDQVFTSLVSAIGRLKIKVESVTP